MSEQADTLDNILRKLEGKLAESYRVHAERESICLNIKKKIARISMMETITMFLEIKKMMMCYLLIKAATTFDRLVIHPTITITIYTLFMTSVFGYAVINDSDAKTGQVKTVVTSSGDVYKGVIVEYTENFTKLKIVNSDSLVLIQNNNIASIR